MTLEHEDGRGYEVTVTKACGAWASPECEHLLFWSFPEEPVPYFEFAVRKTHLRKGAPPKGQAGDLYDRPVESAPNEKEMVCKGESLEGGALWQGVQHAGIFFEGDHFDADHKTISATAPKDGWFNLACAGTVIAKMHLLRHTRAGSATSDHSPRKTTIKQRTAMLKMMTADYCGDGKAWTADGTPLLYTNPRGWYPHPRIDVAGAAKDGTLEAIWGPEGALCLNAPRRLNTSRGVPGCTPPVVGRNEVEVDCKASGRRYRWDHSGVELPAKKMGADIPRCDAGWADWWVTVGSTRPDEYVASINSPTPGAYCETPPP